MKSPEQTARKKNKGGDPNCGPVIIIESPKRHCSDLGKKVRPKKLKALAKQKSSEPPDPKNEAAGASSIVVIESSPDVELLRDAKKRSRKAFKKEKARKLFCIQIQNAERPDEGQPGPNLHAGKKGAQTVLEVGRPDKKEAALKRKKKKKEKRKDKPACPEFLHGGERKEPAKQITGEPEPGGQDQKERKTVEQKAVSEEVEKKHIEYHEGGPKKFSKQDVASYKREDAQNGDGLRQRPNDLAPRSEKEMKKKKKKKKKKQLTKTKPASFSCLATIQENSCGMMGDCSRKGGSGKGPGVGKTPKGGKKAAKKEAKTGKGCPSAEAGRDALSKVGAPGGKEKRKKAKKRKAERGDRDGLEGGQGPQVKKKRKNKGIENSQDSGKKVKKEKETKKQIAEDEIKLVAFRKGNCDEVKIDKASGNEAIGEFENLTWEEMLRRQALQEEIDRESGKTKIAKEGSDRRLGQWSTATFETPEQMTKFHRLMGGFKQGFAPAQRSPAKASESNMALDRPREQELHHNLEAEFKKAVEFKHHRGIGLGFQSGAPSGVHIDKYASKSIKFEA